MGCAPSKQNTEQENDPEKRPLSGKEKKSPKGRKSPKKDRAKDDKVEKENAKNNNAKDGPIVAETVVKTESQPITSATTPVSGEQNGKAPVDQTDAQVHKNQVTKNEPVSPSSPIKEIAQKYGELWDLTRGMPPPTSPYDDGHSPPPKPERMHHHTFPRSRQKQHSSSDHEDYKDGSTLERKISLRERTPDRRKDLDLSGNIYLGKSVEPPGRGRKIDAERLDFLNIDGHPDDKDLALPKLSVKERAQTYLEQVKKAEEKKSATSPIRRPVRKLVEEDSGDESRNKSFTSQDGNISIIEVVNKEILEDYHEVEKKTYEEIEKEMRQRAAEEAERERIRKEEEERRRAEEEEQERIRQEEEAKRRAEEEEQERIRREEEERIHAEDTEQERISKEAEIQDHSADTEGGEIDPAEKGAQLEDRFYNNKAFEKPDIDASNPEQQDAALKIQTKYRQHHAKEVVKEKRQEQAAIKIQAGYRGWHDRKRVKELKSHAEVKSEIDAQKAHEDDTRGDALNYDNPEVVNAATTIQAGFKGYKARKQVQELKARRAQEGSGHDESQKVSEPEEQVTEVTSDDKQVVDEANKQVPVEAAADDKQVTDEVAEDDKQVPDAVVEAEQIAEKAAEPDVGEDVEKKPATGDVAEGENHTTDITAEDKQVTSDAELGEKVDQYPEEQQAAATKIQAGVRGYLARKQVKAMRDGQATSLPESGEDGTVAEPTTAEGAESAAQEDAEPVAAEAEQTQDAEISQQKQEVEPDEDIRSNVSQMDSPPPVADTDEASPAGGDVNGAGINKTEDQDDHHEEINYDAPNYDDHINDDSESKHVITDVIDGVGDETDEGGKADDSNDDNILKNGQLDDDVHDHEEGDKGTSKAIDYNDPEVEKAATKIQAGLRGMQARKKVKELKQMQQDGKDDGNENEQADGDAAEDEANKEPATGETTNNAEFGFDPNDPEVNKAASKIQAGFKGYKTRKEIGSKQKGEEQSGAADDGEKPAE